MSPIYVSSAPATNAVFVPPTDTSDPLADPSPTDDPSLEPTDTSTDTDAAGATSTPSSFLENKGAVAAVSSLGGIAALAILIFVGAFILRRRARTRRQNRWDRKSHVWVDGADQNDGMAGFEKVEPGSAVQMGSIPNTYQTPANNYHNSYNSSRDYFAPPDAVVMQQPSQDGHGHEEHYEQDYSNQAEYPHQQEYPPNILDAYGASGNYPQAHEHAQAQYTEGPGVDYPPGMVYSPELHDHYDAQQQQRLQNLHQYTLEPSADQQQQQQQYGYNQSPLAHAINRGAY